MAVNSSAVYGCTRGPFRPTEDLVSTPRTVNGRTDVHVPLLRIPEAGELVLDLPTEGVVEVELLGGDRPVHAPHASGGLAARLPESVSALSIPVLRVRYDESSLPTRSGCPTGKLRQEPWTPSPDLRGRGLLSGSGGVHRPGSPPAAPRTGGPDHSPLQGWSVAATPCKGPSICSWPAKIVSRPSLLRTRQ